MRVLNVVEATAYIKDLVEFDPILSDVWVRGEITNLSRSAAGHTYFSLTADNVQLNCVLFRGDRARLLASPLNGEAVLAHGRFSIYESRGQYQLIVDNIAPEGMGILQLQYEDTKRRLEDEGLFAVERKRPLPPMPVKIGVVTSEHGAVWHDIQAVVSRRFPVVQLVLAPSSVQGTNAPTELISALKALEEAKPDVIIIGRGGGSLEDLSCFNNEQLARAIFSCPIPVVSAVGHETDICIADLVSDVRAATPSAAAELCVPDMNALLDEVDQCTAVARNHLVHALRGSEAELLSVQATIRYSKPMARVERYQHDTDAQLASASRHLAARLESARSSVDTVSDRARLLDPAEVLRRGYAVITAIEDGNEVRMLAASVAANRDYLTITFADGAVVTTPIGSVQ